MREAAPLQADDIEAGERGAVAERDAEGDDVVLDAREAADEGVGADADELMRGGAAAENGEIADLAMAGQHHVVGEDDALADAAIMRDMGVGEEHASAGRRSFREPPPAVPGFIVTPSRMRQSSPIDKANRLAAIFEVLRLDARSRRRDR